MFRETLQLQLSSHHCAVVQQAAEAEHEFYLMQVQ